MYTIGVLWSSLTACFVYHVPAPCRKGGPREEDVPPSIGRSHVSRAETLPKQARGVIFAIGVLTWDLTACDEEARLPRLWPACHASRSGRGEGTPPLGEKRLGEAVRWASKGREGRGMHGREEAGLLDRTGWGAILGRKHLPTAFGSFEGKRPKRGREQGATNDGVPSVRSLGGEPVLVTGPKQRPPTAPGPLLDWSLAHTPDPAPGKGTDPWVPMRRGVPASGQAPSVHLPGREP